MQDGGNSLLAEIYKLVPVHYLEKGNATQTLEGIHNYNSIQERGKD